MRERGVELIGKAKKNVKNFFRGVERNIAREDRYRQLGGWCLLPCLCDLVFEGRQNERLAEHKEGKRKTN
jgi:hypothetical protein